MEKSRWIQSVLQALAGLSRTLGGVSDTSSAAEKPKLADEGEALARRTRENLEQALEFLWENRERRFASPAEARQFVDALAEKVSAGLLQPGQPLYRTWETKFRQTPVAKIEAAYSSFCEWLFGALADADAVKIAALVEKRLDGEIHPFADGCGRTSKLLAAFVLLRAGFPPVMHRSRKEYYERISASDEEWICYYRALVARPR